MNLAPDADTTPRCVCCHRPLRHTEGYACQPCEQRADGHLAQLAGPDGLYAALDDVMAPERSGDGGPVSGSRHAPLPVRLGPLSLSARGGVVTVLQSWQVDWHERLGWTHPRWRGGMQQQCDQVVHALRVNLPWAAGAHPAFDEFAREVAQLAGSCRAAVTGERREKPLRVVCATTDCGGILHITLNCDGRRCPRCDTSYSHSELLDLDLAGRSVAA